MVKHPPSGGDHTRGHEGGSVKHQGARDSPLDSSSDVESSRGDDSSSCSISSARERRLRDSFRTLKFARDRDSD